MGTAGFASSLAPNPHDPFVNFEKEMEVAFKAHHRIMGDPRHQSVIHQPTPSNLHIVVRTLLIAEHTTAPAPVIMHQREAGIAITPWPSLPDPGVVCANARMTADACNRRMNEADRHYADTFVAGQKAEAAALLAPTKPATVIAPPPEQTSPATLVRPPAIKVSRQRKPESSPAPARTPGTTATKTASHPAKPARTRHTGWEAALWAQHAHRG